LINRFPVKITTARLTRATKRQCWLTDCCFQEESEIIRKIFFPYPFPGHCDKLNKTNSKITMGNILFNRRISQINLFGTAGVFTREQIEEYQDCTFFTKKDIMRLYKRFYALSPGYVPGSMQGGATNAIAVPYEEIEKMPELKENPFRKRICQVFSSDGSGNLTFNDFLDMFSVLSESAPLDLKLNYAFRIYDFDQDNMIGRDDIEKAIRCLTREELTEDEVEFIISRIMDEADLDMSNFLSFAEFEHVVSRSPDFCRTFHIRI
ncbi:Calcium and integrin-binding family member 2, partial [Trichinella pseudospiralis]